MFAKKEKNVKFIDLSELVPGRVDFGQGEKFSIAIAHLRCAKCNKLLAKPNAKGKIAGQIKCPRCRIVNEI